MIDSFCLQSPQLSLQSADEVIFAGDSDPKLDGVTFYKTVREKSDVSGARLYLPSLCDCEDDVVNAVADASACGADVLIKACYNLEECGKIESRFKLSPIMLLHKIGVLPLVKIVGGVVLDNDDIDLMVQEGTPLILLPTYCAAMGWGFAPVNACMARGLKMRLGTGADKNNSAHSLRYEAEFLSLTASAEMKSPNAFPLDAALRLAR